VTTTCKKATQTPKRVRNQNAAGNKGQNVQKAGFVSLAHTKIYDKKGDDTAD
jgi:hypothetical protein